MHGIILSANKIYYMILAVIGVPVNLLAIMILSRGNCGLSSCTTCYLVAMAASDLIVLISEVILRQINAYYFPLSFLDITPVCSIIYVSSTAATSCSVWFTVTFSFDRFVTICCQKLKTKYCTKRNAVVVLSTTCTVMSLNGIDGDDGETGRVGLASRAGPPPGQDGLSLAGPQGNSFPGLSVCSVTASSSGTQSHSPLLLLPPIVMVTVS
ncbi:probable G-protein coupled receptor 139 [Stegostoma tigrinum]|uniref:probable G-protein coupled receptor 139 n=1 Tax=Stegostoma tigrinum TaxID=3053191 RepID=UPI0028701BAF|nr:probable G-protein coupled receptor 139 [Stegostoma tigrinum]XP_059498897.1 probable G-protein coupled receptor 139 [Stegostoma tigrinum]